MSHVVVLAHAKWFVDLSTPFPTDWTFMLDPATLAMAGAAAVFAGLWTLGARRGRIPDLPTLPPLMEVRPLLPRLVSGSLGVALLGLAGTGSFLAPHLTLPLASSGWALALEGAIGAWLISGVRARDAAAAVGLLAFVGLLLVGPVPVLESAHLWGAASFLWLADRQRPLGLTALRLGLGAALVTAAVTEKLAAPALAMALLRDFPAVNLPQLMGLGLDAATFVRIAASAELLLGLLLMSGATPRMVAGGAMVLFLAPVPLFGGTELLGHLAIYGALLALMASASTVTPRRPERKEEPATPVGSLARTGG